MAKTKDSRSNNPGRPLGSKNKTSPKSTPKKVQPTKQSSSQVSKNVTPVITNLSEKVHPIEEVVFHGEQEEIVQSSENPPEHSSNIQPPELPAEQQSNTFKSVLNDTIEVEMINPREKSTFLIQKELCETESFPDDDSTIANDNTATADFPNSVRLTMMFKLPNKTGDYCEDDAPIISIQVMNQMIKALTNKLQCRVGPWNLKGRKTTLKMKDLVRELPEDVDFVESYVYGYSRFLRLGKTGYVRLHIFYSEDTSLAEIKSVINQFRIPRTQFLEVSHSNAISPVTIGTLTGSVEAMANSSDFKKTFQYKFNLTELGLWWSTPRQAKKGDYNANMAVLHIEIETNELVKRQAIEAFFNHKHHGLDNHFFGVPMLLTTPFQYFADDDKKANLAMHSRKQLSLGKSITSTTISGVCLNNWANSNKTSTLLRELMAVESITEKQILKGKKTTKFKGRLFYAVIPNNADKTIKFHFTKANAREGRSVARGLPCFIKDYFELDPAFFCTSDALLEALAGSWDYTSRKFLSAQEKMEADRLDDMEAEVNAEPTAFISKDHQRAMALDTDEVSIETRLTKGDAAPPPAIHIDENEEDQSALSGSTRESKAKRYADAAVKEVAAEYSGTIINMSNDLGQKDDKIAELERLLKSLQRNHQQDEQEPNTDMSIDNEDAEPKDNDDLLSYEGESNDDLEEEDNPSLDRTARNENNDKHVLSTSYLVPPTPKQTAPNIPEQHDHSLKRRSTDNEDSTVDTNRSTRAKTSLQIATQEKTSSSEGADAL